MAAFDVSSAVAAIVSGNKALSQAVDGLGNDAGPLSALGAALSENVDALAAVRLPTSPTVVSITTGMHYSYRAVRRMACGWLIASLKSFFFFFFFFFLPLVAFAIEVAIIDPAIYQ